MFVWLPRRFLSSSHHLRPSSFLPPPPRSRNPPPTAHYFPPCSPLPSAAHTHLTTCKQQCQQHGDDDVAHQRTCHVAQIVTMRTIITIRNRKLSSPLPSPIPSFTPNAGATSPSVRQQAYTATHEQQFAHPKRAPPHPLVMTTSIGDLAPTTLSPPTIQTGHG